MNLAITKMSELDNSPEQVKRDNFRNFTENHNFHLPILIFEINYVS